jgi:hypothetical protein
MIQNLTRNLPPSVIQVQSVQLGGAAAQTGGRRLAEGKRAAPVSRARRNAAGGGSAAAVGCPASF